MNLVTILLLSGLLFSPVSTESVRISSPGDVLQVIFSLENGAPYYRIQRFGKDVIALSRLGFMLKSRSFPDRSFLIASDESRHIDETWTQVWGEKREIRNHYHQLRIDLEETGDSPRRMILVFRVYDDGVAFRYEIPEQPELTEFQIMDEFTEFTLSGDHLAWWIPAFRWNRYEYLYSCSPVSGLDTVHTPLTLETEDGLVLSIHEAALTDYASMALARTDRSTLKADLVPWSDGVRVRTAAPMRTPWRTIQIVDTPGELITSYLILNCNEPNRLKDVSWIKPGKYTGIWWEMHLGTATWGSGPAHGATTRNVKRSIDFASRFGLDGVLVEGWNVGWDGDWIKNGDKFRFTKPYDDFDIHEVTRYATEKGVRLIGHHETGGSVINYEGQMKKAFEYYSRLGVRMVKTGYVNHGRNIRRLDETGKTQMEWHHGQFMVRHYRRVVEEAAKHRIMLNVHEPIKDTGIRRTFPNMMTREGARGQEFNAWSPDGGNPPEHTTILPFTRLLAGPMDYTPGIFDLIFRDARPENRVNSTLAKQLALYVVLYSPLHMVPDLPENYLSRPDAFQFIVDVPVDWQDTRVLNASIGDYVTIVRKERESDDWYLGSITDENGRILKAPLNFLDPDKIYMAEIYRDGEQADWVKNPYDFRIEKRIVDYQTTFTLRLAPGGGQAVRFRPSGEDDFH
jgi:alpha-glucosidase